MGGENMFQAMRKAAKLGISLFWLLSMVSVIGLTAPQGRAIEVIVSGLTVMYRIETTWDKEGFADQLNSYMCDPAGYLTSLLSSVASKWPAYGVTASDWEVELSTSCTGTTKEIKWRIVLHGQVHGAVSVSGNRYLAHFQWLLTPLGLDFIDSHFVEREDGLFWQGELSGVPTTITVRVPACPVPYYAWHEPNGHCHAHVWWSEQK